MIFLDLPNPFAGNSLSLSNTAQRAKEDTTHKSPDCLVLNEQLFGGLETCSQNSPYFIGELTKYFTLCKSNLLDFT